MKYLLYSGPGIGDFVFNLPIAKAIKEYDKDAFIKLFHAGGERTNTIFHEMMSLQNYIDDVDYYSVRDVCHSLSFLRRSGFRKYDYGVVVQYTVNKCSSLWPYRIVKFSAKRTAGISLPGRRLKYNAAVPFHNDQLIASMPFELLRCLDIDLQFSADDLFDKSLLIIRAQNLKLNLNENYKTVAFCIGAGKLGFKYNGRRMIYDHKSWPLDYWVELANKFTELKYNVLLLGGNAEKDKLHNNSNAKLNGDVIDLIGRLSVADSISVLMLADIVVGADTGLVQCSGALDKPTLVLFGCTDYNTSLPLGSKSHYITSCMECSPCYGTAKALECENSLCMKNITVDEVYTRSLEILHAKE